MPPTTKLWPKCLNDPRQLKTETTRNLVEPSGNRNIEDDIQNRICKTQDCSLVYLADDINQQIVSEMNGERPNFNAQEELN